MKSLSHIPLLALLMPITASAEIPLRWSVEPSAEPPKNQHLEAIQKSVTQGLHILEAIIQTEKLEAPVLPRITIHLSSDIPGAAESFTGWYTPATPEDIWIKDEILYRETISTGELRQTVATILHEVTHAIHKRFNPHQVRWIDEGLATLLTALTTTQLFRAGYIPLQGVEAYLKNPSICLDAFPADHYDERYYGFSYLFFSYLWEHFGRNRFLEKLIQSPTAGAKGLDLVLRTLEENHHLPREIKSLQSSLAHFGLTLITPNMPNRFRLTQLHLPFELKPLDNPQDPEAAVFQSPLQEPCLILSKQTDLPEEFDPRAQGELWYRVSPNAKPSVSLWDPSTSGTWLLGIRTP